MNHVSLIGRLTRDPEMRYFESGAKKTTLSIAIDRFNGKDKEKTTDFIDCEAWSGRAEAIGEHFRKGQKIGITGNLKYETWEDDQGKKRSKLIVVIDNFDFCEGKKEGGGGSGGNVGKPKSDDDIESLFGDED